jgi:hypothetical protein
MPLILCNLLSNIYDNYLHHDLDSYEKLLSVAIHDNMLKHINDYDKVINFKGDIYYLKDDKLMYVLIFNGTSRFGYFNYTKIWYEFDTKYSMNHLEIQYLINKLFFKYKNMSVFSSTWCLEHDCIKHENKIKHLL